MTSYDSTLADIFDARYEQEAWDKIIDGFQSSPLLKRFKKKKSFFHSQQSLFEILMAETLSQRWGDKPFLHRTKPYFYDELIGFEEKRRWPFSRFAAPRSISMSALFKEYLGRLKSQPLNRDARDMVVRMDNALVGFPTLAQERKGRLTDHPSRSVPLISSSSKNPKDAYATAIVPDGYKTSYLKSITTSALLGGASRIAIMACFGGLGFSGVGFAVAAGVGAGMVTSYYKNRDVIKREVELETSFLGRMKARARGFRKSYSKSQFLINVGASSLGVVGGGALFEAIAENVPLPKFAQDFAAAAQSQINTALEWSGERAALAASYLGAATDISVANASSYLEMARDFVADHHLMGQAPADAQTAAAYQPDPLEKHALADKVVVLDTLEPNVTQEIVWQELPDAPAMIEEPVSAFPDEPIVTSATPEIIIDPVARAFADAGDVPQADAQTAQWMESFAKVYAEATAPAPSNEVLAYTADDLRGTTASIEQQLAAATVEQGQGVSAAADIVGASSHTVVSGDKLWDLAEKLRDVSPNDADGHHQFIRQVMNANPDLKSPNDISIGQTLVIPAEDALEARCRTTRSGARYIGGCTPVIG